MYEILFVHDGVPRTPSWDTFVDKQESRLSTKEVMVSSCPYPMFFSTQCRIVTLCSMSCVAGRGLYCKRVSSPVTQTRQSCLCHRGGNTLLRRSIPELGRLPEHIKISDKNSPLKFLFHKEHVVRPRHVVRRRRGR